MSTKKDIVALIKKTAECPYCGEKANPVSSRAFGKNGTTYTFPCKGPDRHGYFSFTLAEPRGAKPYVVPKIEKISEQESDNFGKTLDSIKHIGEIKNGELICSPNCPHHSHK